MNILIESFQLLDYIISVVMIIIIIVSTLKGFIQSFLGLLTWIGSIIITLNFFNSLANYISHQLNKINFFENWDQLTQLLGIILSIPLIFFISLIILKRIRKIISADIDKATLGIILDKFFGIVYGFIFSYIICSTILYLLLSLNQNYLFFENLYYFLVEKSLILNQIDSINNTFLFPNIPFINLIQSS